MKQMFLPTELQRRIQEPVEGFEKIEMSPKVLSSVSGVLCKRHGSMADGFSLLKVSLGLESSLGAWCVQTKRKPGRRWKNIDCEISNLNFLKMMLDDT